jgi:hypothetical protein
MLDNSRGDRTDSSCGIAGSRADIRVIVGTRAGSSLRTSGWAHGTADKQPFDE